jgi:hypothetical protein
VARFSSAAQTAHMGHMVGEAVLGRVGGKALAPLLAKGAPKILEEISSAGKTARQGAAISKAGQGAAASQGAVSTAAVSKAGVSTAAKTFIGVSAVFLIWDTIDFKRTIQSLIEDKKGQAGNALREAAAQLRNME